MVRITNFRAAGLDERTNRARETQVYQLFHCLPSFWISLGQVVVYDGLPCVRPLRVVYRLFMDYEVLPFRCRLGV